MASVDFMTDSRRSDVYDVLAEIQRLVHDNTDLAAIRAAVRNKLPDLFAALGEDASPPRVALTDEEEFAFRERAAEACRDCGMVEGEDFDIDADCEISPHDDKSAGWVKAWIYVNDSGCTTDCDECQKAIPDSEENEVNAYHAESCSLHPKNVK